MKIKGIKNIKYRNSNKIKRKVSIITVFLWIFLIVTIITVVTQNIKNTNGLESDNVEIYGEIGKLSKATNDTSDNKPQVPTADEIISSIGPNIVINFNCANTKENHNAVKNGLESYDKITVGKVIENDGSDGISSVTYPWICDIGLDSEYWLNVYNEFAIGNGFGNHLTVYNGDKLRLYYNKSTNLWDYRESDLTFEFEIIETPTVKTIYTSGRAIVKMQCEGSSSDNRSFYSLISDDSFSIGKIVVNNGYNGMPSSTYPYMCDIKLNSKFWVEEYGLSNHWLKYNGETLKLYYNRSNNKWYFYNIPFTITMTHIEPEPLIFNKIVDSGGKDMVKIICKDSSEHTRIEDSFINDNFIEAGEIMLNDESDGVPSSTYPYMCDIKLKSNIWLNYYNNYDNKDFGQHWIVSNENTLRLYYSYDRKSWTYKVADIPIEIEVSHIKPPYTVIYKDGVEYETVFEDQVYKDLYANSKTPKFNGAPTRDGYEFIGWSSEVNEIVDPNDSDENGVITYTAMWKEIGFTVVYTDGVEDENIFEDQVYRDSYANSKTPEFNGTPTRNGYKFIGWSPSVNPIISSADSDENNVITYTAIWLNQNSILDRDNLFGILRSFVKVHCVNNIHEDKLYTTWGGNLDGLYETSIGDVYYSEEEKLILCDVTLNGEVYNSMYKCEPSFGSGINHHLVKDNDISKPAISNEDTKKTITLYYDETEEKWKKFDNIELPIVFNVRCGICPESPTREELPSIVGENFVKIHCISNPRHYDKDKYYSIVDETTENGEYEASIGEIHYSEEKNVYLCNVDLNGSIYTEKYSSEMGVHHELDASEIPYKEVTLYYDESEGKWKILNEEQLPIVFNVRCNYTEVEGFYKVNHEYYIKDKSNNMILEGTLNSQEVKIIYGLGERIEVGLSSGFNKVDIEVEKVPNYTIDNINYTYDYFENSGNVILEESVLKEITLKYVREEQEKNETKIKAEKIWEDENNKYGKRSDNVVLQIKNGEEIVAEKEVSEKNNWSCEFVVPKYDKDGNEIEYTVDEKETSEYYEKIIDGYTVINKYIEEEKIPDNNNEVKNDGENVDTSDISVYVYVVIFFVAILGVNFVRKNKLSIK